jgi:iron(III) transport system substrate-binding protein
MGHSFAHVSLAAAAAFFGFSQAAMAGGEVNVYSNRPAEIVQPLLDAFTRATRIETNLLYLDQGLVQRIQSEGDYSPADVILSIDDSRMSEAVEGGITQPLIDPKLASQIPEKYRDRDGNWIGLTVRPRVFYVSSQRVKDTAITYESLTGPEWKGRVCIRDGRHPSNIGLFASMTDLHGATYTEKWLLGLKANLARKPKGSDRSQAEAIAEGVCDLAIGNAEYAAVMLVEERASGQDKLAEAIRIVFPNQIDRGTSVGLSSMALAKHAPNRDNAIKLMEFLADKPAQELYSNEVNEYPVLPGAQPSDILKGFGPMKTEDLAVGNVLKLRGQALELVEKVRFNDGPGN